jgi:hypothetical protein
VALIDEREGATGRANINRLPQAVEHQDLSIQEGRIQKDRALDITPLSGCQRDK